MPQVIFTEPEVAAVGLTEEQARARGLTVRAVDYEIGRVTGAALHADSYSAQARMVVDTDRNVIVGMTFVGPSTGELIQAAPSRSSEPSPLIDFGMPCRLIPRSVRFG